MKKSTKIIGAVLGVLLVAALFTGAAAAAAPTEYKLTLTSEPTIVNDNIVVDDKLVGNMARFELDLCATDPAGSLANTAYRIEFDGEIFKVGPTLDYNFSWHGDEPGFFEAYDKDGKNITATVLQAIDANPFAKNNDTQVILTIPSVPGEGAPQIHSAVFRFGIHPEVGTGADDESKKATVRFWNGAGDTELAPMASVTVIATYDINYALDGGAGTLPTEKKHAVGDTFQLPLRGDLTKVVGTVPYVLTGWKTGDTTYAPGATYTMTTADKTFTAVWTAYQFVLGAGVVLELGSGPINIGDVEVWKLMGSGFKDTVWTAEDGSKVKFLEDPNATGADKWYIHGDAVDGTYTYTPEGCNVTLSMNVKHLDLPVVGYVVKKVPNTQGNYEAVAGLSGETIDVDSFYIQVPGTVAWINPAGSLVTLIPSELGIKPITAGSNIFNAAGAYDFGEYTIAAAAVRDNTYSSLAPAYIIGESATFELKSLKDSTSLKALSDEILQGEFVTIAITAPYETYNVEVDKAIIPGGQVDVALIGGSNQKQATVDVGLSGEATFVVKSNSSDDVKVTLYKKGSWTNVDKTVTIKVKAGEIKADSSAATYIGNEVKITGTNDLGGSLTLFIKGPNFKFAEVTGAALTKSPNGKEWEAKINTGALQSDTNKKPDAGNYTIYVAKLVQGASISSAADLDDSTLCDAYTTVVVALKQPFISITEAPSVVVQEDNLYVKGTAEGQPGLVRWYVFGTNFFASETATVDDDGVFEIDTKIHATDGQWQAGQYFLVVQHPMYDKNFNIAPFGNKITKNTAGPATARNTEIIDTNERQSANAAQALCDALDDQNIDDMYVKASFFVAGPSSVIGAIPEQVTKGEALTISGVAIGHKKEVVSVELLSTAFAAVPKETVGSASFVTATARIDDDGLWTVTIDTSDLNADDYTISVSVGSLDPATQKIKIVEGSVTPQPTGQPTGQPTAQPTGQPTQTPASPGFGILAALAGLGAVAVLLLRRQ